MRFTFLILILLTSLSCKESSHVAPLDTTNEKFELAKDELDGHSEKIVLLSEIKRISYDSLSNILLDYYTITSYYADSDSSKFYSQEALNKVSKKYHIQKAKIASLIFSFKYEMLSREDIANEEFDKREEEQAHDDSSL